MITVFKKSNTYMHMPIIQMINRFLDNNYVSFLIYHKEEEKESKSVSSKFIYIVTYCQNSFTNCTFSGILWILEPDAWKVILISSLTV